MTIRSALLAVAGVLLATSVSAQESGEATLKQLELPDGKSGYAVVVDSDGSEHHCDARVGRDAVDLGPCRPLRLVTPLVAEEPEAERTRIPTVSPAKAQVISLFERNGCALSYAELQKVIEPLGARQRKVISELIGSMTERGEIADDRARERAILQTGQRCG